MSNVQDQPVENVYDVVPYPDFPYTFSHPRHLESMALLFGMQPPPITACRVLELGCAGGGNLIPQALDLPESRFLGIDLSERQVQQGLRTVQALGLTNIELRQANIMDVDDGWGQFDYVISHGVFSWVPPEVQDKLLEICARNLAPDGVAFVSYNTYPGWHLAGIVRDLMQYHAAQFTDPEKKIEQAKAMLEFLVELGDKNRAWGMLLEEELEVLRRANNDNYLFHEHLEADNHPVYFHQFIAQAQAKGLQYLADAEFSTMLLQNLPERAHQPFSRLPLIPQEQYMDFVRGRRFRKTLLCHQEVALQRHLTPAQIPQFHFVLADVFDPVEVDIRNEEMVEFKAKHSTLVVSNRLAKAALTYLRESYPRHVSFQQLYATALARVGLCRPADPNDPSLSADLLAEALLKGYTVGFFKMCLHPPQVVSKASDRPVVSPLARLQAARGERITNQLHDVVTLDPIGRRLLHRLDGCHDRTALVGCVQEAVAAGELTVKASDQVVEKPDAKTLADVLDRELSRISAAALLIR